MMDGYFFPSSSLEPPPQQVRFTEVPHQIEQPPLSTASDLDQPPPPPQTRLQVIRLKPKSTYEVLTASTDTAWLLPACLHRNKQKTQNDLKQGTPKLVHGAPQRMRWGGRGRHGDTCTPVADSCQSMAKPPQYCKALASTTIDKLIF